MLLLPFELILKFLFHTYFTINQGVYPAGSQTNYALLVKDVKLPSFSMDTPTLNQYNRKRIIQTKIKYDPIDISFHDDNANQSTQLWESYYNYYYNDGTRPGAVLPAAGTTGSAPYGQGAPGASYNLRDIYQNGPVGSYDWGFSGGVGSGTLDSQNNTKTPFFQQITVFGFNQHQFTAYTLINPIINSFSHDTYSYADSAGTMSNKMTIDYETVVYNYGALDGQDPGNIVTGFGQPGHYDTTLSPISLPGSNSMALGQNQLVNADGGYVSDVDQSYRNDAAIQAAGVSYSAFNNPNLNVSAGSALNTMLAIAGQNAPTNRNTLFNFPGAQTTPGPAGLASAPVINALTNAIVSAIPNAGTQYNG